MELHLKIIEDKNEYRKRFNAFASFSNELNTNLQNASLKLNEKVYNTLFKEIMSFINSYFDLQNMMNEFTNLMHLLKDAENYFDKKIMKNFKIEFNTLENLADKKLESWKRREKRRENEPDEIWHWAATAQEIKQLDNLTKKFNSKVPIEYVKEIKEIFFHLFIKTLALYLISDLEMVEKHLEKNYNFLFGLKLKRHEEEQEEEEEEEEEEGEEWFILHNGV